ncbi:VOC family protein [Saccharomonospora sp. NPDC006951]
MGTRLRQVALIAGELEPVVAGLRAVLGLDVCLTTADEIELWGTDLIDRFGIGNAVFAAGDTFLEVISPSNPETPAARYLSNRGGDSGYMVLLQTGDLAAVDARARELGVRTVWESPLPGIRGRHFDPRDTGGSLLSLEQPDDPGEWPWAGPDWRARSNPDIELTGVEVECGEPERVAARWAELIGTTVTRGGDGVAAVELTKGRVRFLPSSGRGEGVCGIEVRCRDRDAIPRRARELGLRVENSAVWLCGIAIRQAPVRQP